MNSYRLTSGTIVETQLPVDTELKIGETHILLQLGPTSGTPDDNIVAFNSDGNFLWKVEPYTMINGDQNPYTSIQKKNDDIFIAYCWRGLFIDMDVHTGKIVHIPPQRPW